jgi:hypothetical protein
MKGNLLHPQAVWEGEEDDDFWRGSEMEGPVCVVASIQAITGAPLHIHVQALQQSQLLHPLRCGALSLVQSPMSLWWQCRLHVRQHKHLLPCCEQTQVSPQDGLSLQVYRDVQAACYTFCEWCILQLSCALPTGAMTAGLL